MSRAGWAARIGLAWMGWVAMGWAQTTGPGGFLGVIVEDVAPDQVRVLGLDRARGVVVTSVVPDSPASAAKLAEKDVVLTWDDETVRSVRQFTRLVQETPAGRPVSLTVRRGRKEVTLTATTVTVPDAARPAQPLSEDAHTGAPSASHVDALDLDGIAALRAEFADLIRHARDAAPPASADAEWLRAAQAQIDAVVKEAREVLAKLPPPPPPPRLGVSLYTLTPDMAANMGIPQGGGALVASVAADSAAQAVGILAGDVVVGIGGSPVTSAEDVTRLVGEARTDTVRIDLLRAGEAVQVEIAIIRPTPRAAPGPRRNAPAT